MAALLAAVLVPASVCAQTADNAPPAAPPADQTPPTMQAPIPATETPNAGQTPPPVQLSPFEVSADQARGYFTPNTTAGTRLNNNIGDIPSSVTVIDKQQIQDTNSQNINDIMLYEANTEGSHTFTPVTGFTQSGGHMDDALAGSNDEAGETGVSGADTLSTRVRGLGAPDNEVDDFYGIYRIPFDTYNVQAVEIDRGPNSLMFGSGSAAGIVNASGTDAQINKLSGDASLQAGSWGEFRQTADLNIPLIRDHVALYVAQEYTTLGFQRQPSSDQTHRQYATITIDPFKTHKTKITASAEFWQNYANDENTLTPYDYVTPWLAAGKPMYNPTTDMVTYLSTGKTQGPYVNSTTSPNYVAGEPTGTGALTSLTSSLFAPGISFASNHLTEMYANGQFLYSFEPAQTIGSNYGGLIPAQTPTTFTAAGQIVRQSQITNSAALPIPGVGTIGAPGGYATWEQPGVNSMDIYNWQDGPNTEASDYTISRARTYHIDLQQEIFNNSKWGSLNADVAFFRQEYRDLEDDVLNQHSPLALDVDTNAVLLNGAPNAYAGSSYLQDYQGDVFERPETNQNWRGMLEYSIDLRDKVPDWLKWLGHHRFMVEASTHDDVNEDMRFRTVIDGGDGSYASELYQLNNTPAIPGNFSIGGQGGDPYRWQYVSAPGSYSVTQAPRLVGSPGYGSPQSFTATTYNYTTGAWVTSGLHAETTEFIAGDTPFQEDVQDQKTYFWQSSFWSDRLIGTLGLNDDVVKNRSTEPPPNAIINGVATATSNNPGLVEYIGGIYNPNYKNYVTPWNPYTVNGVYSSLGEIGGNTYSTGFVLKPFENWSGIDAAANNGNILAAFVRTLGFTFNKSDNFNPPAAAYTDLFGNPLPKPTGTEKDYGLEVATPDKKLFFRMTWFNTSNQNNTIGVSSTITTRTLYVDQNEFKNWATTIVELNSGENPTLTTFGNQTLFPLSNAQQQQVASMTGLNYNFLYQGPAAPLTGGYFNQVPTNTTTSGGYDVELTYNPLPNWTMKITGGHQYAELSAVDPQAKAYLTARMPVWQAASTSQYPTVISNWLGAGAGAYTYLGNFWNSYGYDSNTNANGNNGGPTTVGNYFQNVVGIPLAVEDASQGTAVPGESPYSYRFLSDYTFDTGALKNTSVILGLRWTSAAIEGYYGDTDPSALNATGQVAAPNLSEPIYTSAELHVDAGLAYSFKMPWDDGKVRVRLQLNCTDITSAGYLLPIQFNYDGTAATYRIIPPRQFAFTTTFSF